MKLTLKQHKQEGDLAWEYNPLHNLINKDGSIVDFDVDANDFNVDLEHPVNIECQPSYDGTINLILNDDKNPPRIINSRFTKVEGNKYRVITRNQKEQTNLYNIDKVDQQTRLFRTLNKFPKFQLYNVAYFGQLKGGNYTFYLKFADNDYNKTDFIAETGEIPIFKGTLSNIKTISGTLADERTDKSIKLKITNIDTSFTKAYLYYSRATSDLHGERVMEYCELVKPYDITGDELMITINGFEETNEIEEEFLNIKYNTVDCVKSQTQAQNRLFFANVEEPTPNNTELQNISYYIETQISNEIDNSNSIGYIDTDYKSPNLNLTNLEYYSPQNVYYRLGYWPEEMYRIGVVYIMNNDSLSPVYNLRGAKFTSIGEYNFTKDDLYGSFKNNGNIVYVPKQDFLNEVNLSNTLGVFMNPESTVFTDTETKPLYYKFTINTELIEELKKNKVKGLFFVRQRRIPTILGQALELGINENCYTPMIWYNDEYLGETFKTSTGLLTTNLNGRILKTDRKQCSGLLSLDTICNIPLQSVFDGSEFVLKEAYKTKTTRKGRHFKFTFDPNASITNIPNGLTSRLNYIPTECDAKVIEDFVYSTKQGNDKSVSEFGWWDTPRREVYKTKNPNIIRGAFSGYIGSNLKLNPGTVYTIKINKFSESFLKEYFIIRGSDNSPFYAISDRYSIYDELDKSGKLALNVYRGDCFVNTISIRLNRNFIDPSVPIDDFIIDEETWSKNYYGYYGAVYTNGKDVTDPQVTALHRIGDILAKKTEDAVENVTEFYKINRADINAVPMGMWITFKCLSNYNLGVRSVDRLHVDELAVLGNPRTFYPFGAMSVRSAYKMADSELLSNGYSSTVGQRVNFKYEDVPYIKDQFDNRIMFSNAQINDQFKNSYRIFQSLSYQDIDRQYGGIVKIYPWYDQGTAQLLCVFEHGIGIVGVNEKALMQTTSGQNVQMYGAGVLSSDVKVISDDFGSTWQDSIIKTPLAIYGVDTYAKKIWKMPLGGGGIDCISDMHIQQFLNDRMTFKESDKSPIIALRNVKTHYNNYKGDVMFTFYDYEHNEEWNFCYNERQKLWTTQYTWTPLASENINNCYYSFDKKRAEILAYVAHNRTCTTGLRTTENMIDELLSGITLTLHGYENLECTFKANISQIRYKIDGVWNIIDSNISDYCIINDNILFGTELLKNLNADWYLIDLNVTPVSDSIYLNEDSDTTKSVTFTSFFETIGIVANLENIRNKVYVHGRAGVYNELNYTDEDMTNHIRPTYWYDKQEPFEFEFVVSQPTGLHKIFNNLVLVSNNVEPNSFEFEIIGDVYDFNKAGLYWTEENCTDNVKMNHEFDPKYNSFKHSPVKGGDIEYQTSQDFENVEVTWDHTLNTYGLKLHQDSKNIKLPEYGRLQGNIHYKEDSWHLTIDPIKYKTKYKLKDGNEIAEDQITKSTRLRDKYCKIRVKYTGEDLAIITSLKTLMTLSYA